MVIFLELLSVAAVAAPPPADAPGSPSAAPAESAAPASGSAPPSTPASAPVPAPSLAPATGRRVLSLADAERNALANQPQILQARAQTRAAYARADEAHSGLYPQVTATANYARGTANFVQRPGALPSNIPVRSRTSFDTFDSFNFGLNATQLVYDFGQTTSSARAAKSSAEAQAESERTTRLSVLLAVRSAHALAWANASLAEVSRRTLANAERHVAQIEGLVRAGARPEIDLAQVRADRANASLAVINAENAYETAKAQLNQAMGVEQDTNYDVSDERIPAVVGEDWDDARLLDSAMTTRPELRTLAKQVEANERQLSSVRGGYGPSLGVSASATEGGRDLTALTWNLSAGANLTWPLFQGGITNARVDEATANLDAARSALSLERQQIRLEIVQAKLSLRAALAAVDAAREVEKNARERLRLADARYQAGAGSIIELEDAEVAEATAAGQVVQADYGLSLARAQLEKGLGRR
ncbi:MAG TPA: TolC family protein [Polyangiaceae bacterium]|nr:TolC family protein [Polyangiaceae bacterium]